LSFLNLAFPERISGQEAKIVIVILILFGFLLPVLPQVSTYHSDEHYYTDAAVYMLQHQELLTPHYADGSLRAKKPILTYWAIMAGYALFGINFFAARLPFLLAGCLMIWLTYRMSLKLFGKPDWALASAVILGSNFQFIMLCLRATPDILQALFINLSLYGFIVIIFHHDSRLRNYLMAYCGAALAVQTKGLLGLVPVVFVFLFVVIIRDKRRHIRHLMHPPVMGFALILALSWYLYLVYQHGDAALERFFSDQVAEKLEHPGFVVLVNFKDYIWGIFRNFFPWSFLVAAGIPVCGRSMMPWIRQHKPIITFICAWCGLLLIVFIGGTDIRTRYLIPAYPLLAILMGGLLAISIQSVRFGTIWKWFWVFLLTLFILVGVILLAVGLVLDWRIVAAGAVILACLGALIWSGMRTQWLFSPLRMGVMLIMVFAVVRALVLPVFEFAPSHALADCIQSTETDTGQVIVWSKKRYNHTRQLYTLSKGHIRMRYAPRGIAPENLDNRSLVILTEKERRKVTTEHYAIEPCGAVFRQPSWKALWPALITGDKKNVFAILQENIYLAKRRS
jgi:4-amino-4-deoxy-L-arabinose transferase-like glycosyltransferase